MGWSAFKINQSVDLSAGFFDNICLHSIYIFLQWYITIKLVSMNLNNYSILFQIYTMHSFYSV